MRELEFGRRAAASGPGRSLVILLHGYGADGNDLLGLAGPLGAHLPHTVFVAPNAPSACSGNPFGYEWFPIPWLDGSSEAESHAAMIAAAEDLDGFIDAQMAAENVDAGQTVLLGFSQGTMMSLHVAPRRKKVVAGVVGFSGRLLAPELLAAQTISRPPVLLIHGDQDDMVPIASLAEAADGLTAVGFSVFTHVSKGTAHGIAPDGLGVALPFMRDRLAAPG